jgi:hypothetical protein
MAVVASATGAAVFGLSGVAAGLAGGALLGAGAGALYSGITGDGNILNSALTGALLGGTAGGLGAAFAPAAAGTGITGGAGATGLSAAVPGAQAATPALATYGGASSVGNMLPAVSAPIGSASTAGFGATGYLKPTLSTAGSSLMSPTAMTGGQKLAAGLAGTTALSALGSMNQPQIPGQTSDPGQIRPYTYSSTPATQQDESPYARGPTYGPDGLPILDTRERRYVNQSYTAGTPYGAANGGLMAIKRYSNGGITYDPATQQYSGLPSSNSAPAAPVEQLPADLVASLTPQYQAANPNFFSYDPKNQRYGPGTPSMAQLNAFKAEQDRMAAQQMDPFMGLSPFDNFSGGANGGLMKSYAMGGDVQGYNLGGYSDGGRLLKGPGDGVSDDIPAVIGNRQPARLADGEFVIPARIVSELGNGSTDAGAKRLYAMMDKIQAGRKKTVGKGNVAKDTKAKKHLLA